MVAENILAWSKQYTAWNEKYEAFIKKHPKPDNSNDKQYDAFMKKHPKPPLSEALVAWYNKYNDFYIKHPFPSHSILDPPTKPHSEAMVPDGRLQPKPIVKIDLDSKSLVSQQMLPQTKTKTLSISDSGNQSLVPHLPKPGPLTESLIPHSHSQADVSHKQGETINHPKDLAILDSSNQSLVPYILQPEPLSELIDLESQPLIPHSACQAVVLHKQEDALNQGDKAGNKDYISSVKTSQVLLLGEKTNGDGSRSRNTKAIAGVTHNSLVTQTNLEIENAKSKNLDLIDFHRKKSKKSALVALGKMPEAQTSSNMGPEMKPSCSEKMDDWNTKFNAWNEEYNAFMKSHPKPPPSKAEVSWEKAYKAFLKKTTLKPHISNKLVAWEKKLCAFYKKNPMPVLSTQPLNLQSNVLKRKSEALIPHKQPKCTSKSDLDNQSQIRPQILTQTKTKTPSIAGLCNQSLVPNMPKPKPLAVVDLDSQSLIPHTLPQTKTKTIQVLDSGNKSLAPHMPKAKPRAVVDLDSQSLIPHMQPQSKTKTLSVLDSGDQTLVPRTPNPKPLAVVDLDSQSPISHMQLQSKTKTLSILDSRNQSLVPHMPKPENLVVVDLGSPSPLPRVLPQSQTKTLSILDSGNQSLVPHVLQPESLVVLDLDSQSIIPHPSSQAVVLHKQGDNLNKGDKMENQKYIAGKSSEVLLLGNSGGNALSTYIDVDKGKTNGISLGSINSLVIDQTNLDLVSIDRHMKKMKTSASGAYSIVPYAQTSINLDDDDVYDIPGPLARKALKSCKNKVY